MDEALSKKFEDLLFRSFPENKEDAGGQSPERGLQQLIDFHAAWSELEKEAGRALTMDEIVGNVKQEGALG